MEILDCTLRDGNHAIPGGFKPNMVECVLAGLLNAGVKVIEFGRASGIGSKAGDISDEEYLSAAKPYLDRGEIGMFCRPEFFGDHELQLVREFKLGFLRVGTHAGKVESSAKTLSSIRKMEIQARYSLIQAHMLSPAELAESGRKVESYGAQSMTIMDSTGAMTPDQVDTYVKALVDSVNVPVGFHGHNNLGFSVANAVSAFNAGAVSLDGALMGLARSAGNAPTEMLTAVLQKQGCPTGIDLFCLLDFIDSAFLKMLGPISGVQPIDLVFGLAGFHSKNLPVVKSVADETGINLFLLVNESAKLGLATLNETDVQELARRLLVS